MSCEKVSIFFPNLFEAGMGDNKNKTYRFKSFLLNVGERQLFDGDKELQLTPKTFDVLVYLVENAGHLVHKDDLMKAVWPDSFVEEVNVPRSVHHLRKTLRQDNNGNRFIETIPTKGYRFTMPVAKGSDDLPAAIEMRSDEVAADRGPAATAVGPPVQTVKDSDHKKVSNAALSRRPVLIGGFLTFLLVLGSFWFGGVTPFNAGTNGQAPPTSNAGAYRLFQEGKLILDRRYENNGPEALPKFEEAIKLDPNYALAHVGKADAEWRVFIRHTQSHDDIARARASINKALALNPANAYAYTVLCRIYSTYDWDFSAAEKACRRAVELDPNSHDAHHELAMLVTQFARHDEALAEIDAAVAIAPTSFNKRNRAVILFHAKRYGEGIKELEEIKASDPESPHWLSWLWWFYAMNRDYDLALESYIDWQKRLGRPESENELRTIYSTHGWNGVQQAIVREFKPGEPAAMHSVALLCQLGKMDETFEFLENELKNRTLWMISLIPDPRFDPCRSDPRFESVLKRVGLK